MVNPNQTTAPILKIIVGVLQTWGTQYNATVIPCSSVQLMWKLSAQTSQAPLIFVAWAGETPWSSNANISALTHRMSPHWIVRVKEGRGFKSVRGDTLYDFIPIVEQCRDTLRSMLGISMDAGIDYEGIKYASMGSQAIDAYDIFFSTKQDAPTIISTPDDSENP